MRRPPPPTTWGPDPADFGLVDRTYVVRITGDLVDGLPVVDLLGEIATGRAGGLTVTVDEVLKGGLGAGGQFVAINGWLVRDALHPCPALPLASGTPSDGPKYGCPDDDYLTDLEFQPLQGDGSSVGPPDGLFLPAGTYDQWAPSPAFFGQYGVGVVPRRATYLVRLVASNPGKELPCGSAAGCSLVTVVRWQIVGRLDPIPELPSTPAELASPSEAPVHSVADFVGGLPADIRPSEFTIRAYLVSTPPLKCVGAAPPGLPDYSCGERDWLTDEPFQPWVADGNTGSTRDPAVGLRVENGAYDLFAPDPGIGAHAAREPRLGTYLVRFAVHSTCDYAIQSPANGCLGGPIFTWEVIGRLP
jgi:hypothetical protein